MNTEERWLPVMGYEGTYEISSLGRIRSVERSVITKGGAMQLLKGKVLKQYMNQYGYFKVNLKLKSYFVHILVAEAFVDNPLPEQFTVVNHKDGNASNNCAWNLEWSSYHYNSTYWSRSTPAWADVECTSSDCTKNGEVQSEHDMTYKEMMDAKVNRIVSLMADPDRNPKLRQTHPDDITERQYTIINVMRQNPTITLDRIVETTKIPHGTLVREVARLTEQGYVRRDGGRKSGTWIVNLIDRKPNNIKTTSVRTISK